MIMVERQVKGIIAVSVILAFIPFIGFFYPFRPVDSGYPVFSTSRPDSLMIEIVADAADHDISGLYFVEPGTTAKQLLSRLDSGKIGTEDFKLQNAMTIRLVHDGERQGLVREKMAAAKRLALGLPIDINLAGFDDLLMIPGVGNKLAENIMARRAEIGRFQTMNQLMEIKGIKEKKLSKLRQYLYIE
jgi:competence protein ComEA